MSGQRSIVFVKTTPFSANPKFSRRQNILETIHGALGPDTIAQIAKSIALFGMGGVGKTQIAIQYAYQNLEQFEVILWVAADNDTTIGESFWAIADGLGQLGSEDEATDAVAAAGAVKKCLAMTSTSTKRFPTCLIPVHLTALL